jgi:hypothetical protein
MTITADKRQAFDIVFVGRTIEEKEYAMLLLRKLLPDHNLPPSVAGGQSLHGMSMISPAMTARSHIIRSQRPTIMNSPAVGLRSGIRAICCPGPGARTIIFAIPWKFGR